MSLLLALMGGLTRVGSSSLSGDGMMAWTLLTLLLLGVLTAVVQGGSFGLASSLPPMYNQALMGGQAVAGVLSAAGTSACCPPTSSTLTRVLNSHLSS